VVSATPKALTVGEIGRRLSEPVHRIEYVIRSRNVKPVSVAGAARVFSEHDLSFIRSEIRRIEEEKGGLL
jgi:hypothetical protein